jgi:hypothetical protein
VPRGHCLRVCRGRVDPFRWHRFARRRQNAGRRLSTDGGVLHAARIIGNNAEHLKRAFCLHKVRLRGIRQQAKRRLLVFSPIKGDGRLHLHGC